MNDEGRDDPGRLSGDAEPAAIRIAANSDSAEAREYLREQIALTKLQKQNLIEQNAFELSHLRWRRFNDQMKGAMQIMLVALGLLIVVCISVAMWNASQADGIVVEAFSVPPSLAADGIDGNVVADDLTNRIAAIRDVANGNSFKRSKDVHGSRDEDIRVEIPETGISLAQAWRYLKAWLGNERPLRGNIRNATNGNIALTVALSGDDAAVFTGPSAALDRLEQRAAERVFSRVDSNNYVLYLDAVNRDAEAYAAVSRFAREEADPVKRSGLTSLWAVMTRVTGDVGLAIARARYSLAIDPKMVIAHREIMVGEHLLGHEEEALKETGPLLQSREEDFPSAMQGRGFSALVGEAAQVRDTALGDFLQAQSDPCFYCSESDALLQKAEYLARAHTGAQARAVVAQAAALGNATSTPMFRTRYFGDASAQNWRAAALDAQAYGATIMADKSESPRFSALKVQTIVAPLRAEATARAGDFAAARALIDGTPRDCYNCIRVRGVIEALRGNWSGAASWFADAVHQAPSLPFAYTDWGAMLFAKQDFDGGIEKFRQANLKGPHFADPLEMWGETLMAKNHSDLALARFEEANKYAPNWGRLHLKWGEALMYTGKKDDAQKQFAIASGLDLTTNEKTEVKRLLHG